MMFAAAILAKLGESSITLTKDDLCAVPFDRIEFSVQGVAEEVTIRIVPEAGDPDQGDLLAPGYAPYKAQPGDCDYEGPVPLKSVKPMLGRREIVYDEDQGRGHEDGDD